VTWLFGQNRFLKDEDEDWHLTTWKWFLQNFGGIKRLKSSPFVNATSEFFPATDLTGSARAQYVFDCVRKLAQAPERQYAISEQAEPADAPPLLESTHKCVLGTFRNAQSEAFITYDPRCLAQPTILVTVFAHELSHSILDPVRATVPGGDVMYEYATDLMTVFLGFGAFGADRALDFLPGVGRNARETGFSVGYLREYDWVFALAVFLELRDQDVDDASPMLKSYLYSEVKTAVHYLKKNPRLLETHRMIQPSMTAARDSIFSR
jgi:hypothetical protein